MTRALALLTVAALSGCMGPRPPLPPESRVQLPEGWRDGTGTPGTTIDAEWWREFGDPVLDALVDQAVRRNDDQRISVARVNEARAAMALARSALLPGVNAHGSGARVDAVSPFGLANQQTAYAFGVSIAYDADVFGRLRDENAAATARLLETESARDTVKLSVASIAAASYISLMALDARLAIAKSTLTLRAESLRLAERRLSAGYSDA